VRENVIINKI